MARTKNETKQPKSIGSTQSLSAFVKSICDVMRRSNCASALLYVPELTWILFLRILDAQEMRSKEEAHDYRYFPEPDLMPFEPTPEWLAALGRALPGAR